MTTNKPQSHALGWVLALPLLLALISLGCGLSNRIASLRSEPASLPTRTPMPTFTPTPQGAAFVEVAVADSQAQAAAEVIEPTAGPTEAPLPVEPSPLPPPTAEPAAEAEPAAPANTAVTLTIQQDMNVRTGPGTNYPVAGPGPAGATATVIGRNPDGSWLQVEYPPGSGSKGWIYTDLVNVSGDPQAVAVADAPAPPPAAAPAAAAQPEQADAPPPEPEKKYQFTPTGWFASENAAVVQMKGRIKDEGGNLVNGYSVYVDNWAWGAISHPTGASPWYPDKGDGEWDMVLDNLHTAQGWWYLTVVRYDCDFWGGFDAQCKNFTRLSEDIPIEVRTPEESIINADWVCHWDCDKGVYSQAFRR